MATSGPESLEVRPSPHQELTAKTDKEQAYRALVILLGAAAAVVVIAGLRVTAWLIGPLFAALIVVIAVAPVQGRLRRRDWLGWATGC